jgi:5,10-methylene-tetrahydrofolate dehydrogenase/methenyl tetrahydrofolate cyclohydrolase
MLATIPSLGVVSIASHPSITSFIKIKRKFGEASNILVNEYNFEESFGEENLITEIQKIAQEKNYTGIIIQLPLPSSYNTRRILDAIPEHLDVDVLGTQAWSTFTKTASPTPPVVAAVAHILQDTKINVEDKNVVVIGQGMLVGIPVAEWFRHNHTVVTIVDINTEEEERIHAYAYADIVVTGTGLPHHLKKEFFKEGVVLIDAGTSEQAGVLAGDCDPGCVDIASVFTPVPGGVGPLTVACLFENIVSFAEKKERAN